MALPLDVLADLQLAVDGEEIDIQASGDHIVMDLPSLRAGRRVLAAYPLSGGRRSQATERLHQALEITGLTLEVRLRGTPVARAGADAQPGRLGRILRLGTVELHPTPLLRTTARRRPLVTALVIGGVLVVLGWIVGRRLQS